MGGLKKIITTKYYVNKSMRTLQGRCIATSRVVPIGKITACHHAAQPSLMSLTLVAAHSNISLTSRHITTTNSHFQYKEMKLKFSSLHVILG